MTVLPALVRRRRLGDVNAGYRSPPLAGHGCRNAFVWLQPAARGGQRHFDVEVAFHRHDFEGHHEENQQLKDDVNNTGAN